MLWLLFVVLLVMLMLCVFVIGLMIFDKGWLVFVWRFLCGIFVVG